MEALIPVCLIDQNDQPVVEDHIQELVEILDSGTRLPAITLRRTGDRYRVVDGRHRLAALRRSGRTHARARITL